MEADPNGDPIQLGLFGSLPQFHEARYALHVAQEIRPSGGCVQSEVSSRTDRP